VTTIRRSGWRGGRSAARISKAMTALRRVRRRGGDRLLPQLERAEVGGLWHEVFDDVARATRILLGGTTTIRDRLRPGCVMGHAAECHHRGEVQKLIVHPEARAGIGAG